MYHKISLTNDRDTKKPKMKKYYQLALAIVCMVSVVTLLFYRHEYYRLRYVLEVLNFFGKPGINNLDPNGCLFSNFSLNGKNLPSFTEPTPSWQRLDQDHFVYSAFWKNTDFNHRVNALSVGLKEPDLKFGCHLWYDKYEEPTAGEFSYRKLSKNAKLPGVSLIVYELYCTLAEREITGNPFGVSFYKTEDPDASVAYIPIHFAVPSTPNITALCVAPTSKHSIQKSTILEFLSYHQLIGVTEFIIYNSESVSRVVPALVRPTIRDHVGLGVSALPWNFPFPGFYNVALEVMETDCLLRTRGKVRSVGTLDWQQYIVPKYHASLSAMLDDLGKSTSTFKLTELTFCTQQPDNSRSSKSDLLFLRKTRYISGPERILQIHQPEQTDGAMQKILPGIAVVHRYMHCTKDQMASGQDSPDSAMFKFSGDLGRSSLLKAWHLGKIFD